jgi:hypothetical protein
MKQFLLGSYGLLRLMLTLSIVLLVCLLLALGEWTVLGVLAIFALMCAAMYLAIIGVLLALRWLVTRRAHQSEDNA